ncbi:arabinose efflux permease family protein [Pseudomonas sp. GM21]|uniref:spinster family MFS transporter n=1 Tax=Pseudomonas sp. GM21 TaxID=1144325 RepID=UPI00027258E5|nr:MFS transporter [Pseudomonas sp. GM21]EJM24338.1 arabinose efflux permease family protein [Pseudomonas sp. GM21]
MSKDESNQLHDLVMLKTVEKVGFANRQAVLTLFLLTLAYVCVALDRAIIAVVLEPIKHEFTLTDTQMGLLPLAFSVLFAVVGVPLGLLADRLSRRNIIIASLFVFSVATTLCGAALSFVHLLLARIGVGAGEAGTGPAAMSIIADLFPDRQRATALSVYYLAAPLGFVLTFALGGHLVGQYGWRFTFFAAGVPGVLLAVVLLLLMREPARPPTTPENSAPGGLAAFSKPIKQMARKSTLRHLTIGITLNAMASAAIMLWCAAFLLRSHGIPVAQAGLLVGVFYGAVSMIGVLAGGVVSDRLSRLGEVWRTRVLALAALFSAPALLGLLLSQSTLAMIVSFIVWAVISSIWYGPAFALTQSLVPVRQRATTASLLYLLTNLIGAGIGPQLVGIFSDALVPSLGVQSLRYAMATMAIIHLWAMWHFLRAGRTVQRELAEVDGAQATL